MKVFLMHRDRDVDVERRLPRHEYDLRADLELDTLFTAMADGDDFLFDTAKHALLWSLRDPAEISYRQHILRDCLEHPSVVLDIYTLAVEALAAERKNYFPLMSPSADSVLHRSRTVLEGFTEMLKKLRQISDEHGGQFGSEGFVAFFQMVSGELTDDYFRSAEEELDHLDFPHGALISARPGIGNKGTEYILHKLPKQSWRDRLPMGDHSSYRFEIDDRDERGPKELAALRGQGVHLAAVALAEATDHVLSFFQMLRRELGFYVGCLNLHRRLANFGAPSCFPEPLPRGTPTLVCRGLYEVSLRLNLGETPIVVNDIGAEGKSLVVITGANQGGKSTLLRSVGLAQLMMQCGMFVAAQSFRADVRSGVFTHFTREEDATMKSGKLDEELARMSGIVDAVRSGGLLLCNESFASTNEQEGSHIAGQIIRVLVQSGIKVFFVTHMFDLANGLYSRRDDDALFLRAERRSDGRRTFRLVEGEPLPTSYGEDLYRRIFGVPPDPVRSAPLRQDPRDADDPGDARGPTA